MTDGRRRRGARRTGAALVLGMVLVLAGWVTGGPSASAASEATVYIRDLTPPVVSVDSGGRVTFINQIADKTLSVGVGPLAVTVTVHTDVTVNLPSGSHVVKPSAAAPPGQPQPTAKDFPDPKTQQYWTESFAQSCVSCTISWGYRVEGAQLAQVLNLLPALPAVPTPFVVNTILPLPNLPGVNLPNLPQINVNLPNLPNLPGQLPNVPGGTVYPGQQSVTTTTTTRTVQGLGGPRAQYSLNGVQMAPSGGGAVPAFDPSRLTGGQGSGTGGASSSIGNPQLANESAARPASTNGFPAPALLALLSLAGVATAVVRTLLSRVAVEG